MLFPKAATPGGTKVRLTFHRRKRDNRRKSIRLQRNFEEGIMKRGITLIGLLACALGTRLLAQTPQKKAAANSSGREMALKNCLDRVETVEWILRCAQNDLILCWVSSPEAFAL